jgi:hypothetical protein
MAAKKDVRYFLNGLHVMKVDDVVKFQATDGHGMIIISITDPEVTQYIEEGVSVILDRDSIATAANALKKSSPTLIAPIDGDVTLGGVKIKIIDGKFPEKLFALGGEVILDEKIRNAEFGMSMLLMGRVTQAASMIAKSWGGDKARYAAFKCHTSAFKPSAFTAEHDKVSVLIAAAPCRL